ncbi:MAG: two-component system sensor kinase FixL [Kiritimatiellia bacterium]|jgi:two-component system sensor kinase FixL
MENQVTNDKFTALLNAATEGMFVIDSQGIIEIANNAVERLLGYDQTELIGRNVKFLMPSPNREQHDSYLSEHLRTGVNKIIGIGREVEALKKDGTLLQIYLSVGKYDDGQAIKFVGIIRDLSDLKSSEEKLESAESEIRQLVDNLAHVSRIGVMGEMAAGIAHEINQPLTAISTYAKASIRLLQAEDKQLDEVVLALDKIENQALRAGDIIRGLRTWIREQDTKREDSDCNALVAEVVEIARMDARSSDIELHLNLIAKPASVVCDSIQIQQVVLNLVKNSIDAVNEYRLEKPDVKREIFILTENCGQERIKVTVTDYGPGISDNVADTLFDPFFTTKNTGMGMGLSICKTIIRAHGGELSYLSNPSGGASFYFILPTSIEIQ